MAWRNDFWGGYAPSKPIEVEGGIKAKSKKEPSPRNQIHSPVMSDE